MRDRGTFTSAADRELQGRTALLDYYKSLMQDYKIYVVTLAISILTILDIWSRESEKFAGMYLCMWFIPCVRLIFLSLGVIASILFGCTWRWLWCGQMVTAVMKVGSSTDPTLSALDGAAKDYAYRNKGVGKKLLWGIAAFDPWKSKGAFVLVCGLVLVVFTYVIIPWFVSQVHS